MRLVDAHDLVKPLVGGVFDQRQVEGHALPAHEGKFVVHEDVIAQHALQLDDLRHVQGRWAENLQIGDLAVGLQRLQRGVVVGKLEGMGQLAGLPLALVHFQVDLSAMGGHQGAEVGHLLARDEGDQHGMALADDAAQAVEIGADAGVERRAELAADG